MLENVNGALPVLVKVTFWVVLVVPSHSLAKVKSLEDRLTPGTCSRTENVAEPGPVTVLAEDWWTYYPLRYLAAERKTMTVVWPNGAAISETTGEPSHRFAVGFERGPFQQWADLHAPELRRQTIVDAAGRPILHVWDLGSRADVQQALFDVARSEGSPSPESTSSGDGDRR